MYLFIAIIFIAELVILSWIIGFVLSLDRKVLIADSIITSIRPKVGSISAKIKSISEQILETVRDACNIVQKRREKILIAIVQNILIYFLIFLLKGKKKKYASLIHLICALRDYWACN